MNTLQNTFSVKQLVHSQAWHACIRCKPVTLEHLRQMWKKMMENLCWKHVCFASQCHTNVLLCACTFPLSCFSAILANRPIQRPSFAATFLLRFPNCQLSNKDMPLRSAEIPSYLSTLALRWCCFQHFQRRLEIVAPYSFRQNMRSKLVRLE